MLDCRSNKFPPELNGMIKVTVEIDVDANGRADIKKLIKDTIQQKKDVVGNVVHAMHSRHDMTKIDKMFAAKIYPANMDDAVPQATRIAKRMYLDQMAAKDTRARVSQAQDVAQLKRGLQDYKFRAPLEVGA
eukprot:scaffold10085_cov168-Amphora_coffeaeformis.AAC.7